MKKLIVLALVLGIAGVASAAVYSDDFESYPVADPWDVSGIAAWDFPHSSPDRIAIENDTGTWSRVVRIYESTDTDPGPRFVAPPSPAVLDVSLYSAQLRLDAVHGGFGYGNRGRMFIQIGPNGADNVSVVLDHKGNQGTYTEYNTKVGNVTQGLWDPIPGTEDWNDVSDMLDILMTVEIELDHLNETMRTRIDDGDGSGLGAWSAPLPFWGGQNTNIWFKGTGTWLLDNVSVTTTPEPATIALLGMGALALIRKRR